MRGGLDDALARIARWEELRRRTQGGTPAEAGLVELAEAIRRVVERYPDLTVAVRARQAGSVLEAQVFTSDGEVELSGIMVTAFLLYIFASHFEGLIFKHSSIYHGAYGSQFRES